MSKNDAPETEKMREEFQFTLSKISHEIRNPVTLIKSFLQMMAEKHPEVEGFDYWDEIQENMDYLVDLLADLSVYNNAFRLTREPLDIREFVQSVADSMIPTLRYLDIRLSFESDRTLPAVRGDRTKLRQLLLNLLRNASEAVRLGGSIRVAIRNADRSVEIDVSDDGPGIPEEYLPTLFEPFVTHKPEGSGLGLAIASRIAEAHGGSLRARSLPEGGACFTLSLPAEAPGAPIQEERQ